MKAKLLKFGPYIAFIFSGLFFAYGLTVYLMPKSEAIKFALKDPEAVIWVKTNLEARELNARKSLMDELLPQKSASATETSYLTPVWK